MEHNSEDSGNTDFVRRDHSVCVYSSLVKRFFYIYIQSHNQRGGDDLARYIIQV